MNAKIAVAAGYAVFAGGLTASMTAAQLRDGKESAFRPFENPCEPTFGETLSALTLGKTPANRK